MNRLDLSKRIGQKDRERWYRTEFEIASRLENGETKQSVARALGVHKLIVESVARQYKIPYDAAKNRMENGGVS
ncbi:hypothetical protein [Peribacillus frigoritolerans]|uniref:Helix-turn-helix domain-containing protein n=1 Tax=Peribacillus frigoritolerans TaxID=450367 RepID=A0AAJ1VA77_9BACI|nr:hypothetical protein [Peribacillus frigoritolerans]MDM5283109.1 hypothetical protein [Peribacillus frigoritolerans]